MSDTIVDQFTWMDRADQHSIVSTATFLSPLIISHKQDNERLNQQEIGYPDKTMSPLKAVLSDLLE